MLKNVVVVNVKNVVIVFVVVVYVVAVFVVVVFVFVDCCFGSDTSFLSVSREDNNIF